MSGASSHTTARSGPRGGAANEQGSALRGNLAAFLASYGLAMMSVQLDGEDGPGGVPVMVRCEVDEPVDDLQVDVVSEVGDSDRCQVLIQVKQRLDLDFKPGRPMAKVIDQWVEQCVIDDAAKTPLVVVGQSASQSIYALRTALNRNRDPCAGLPTTEEKRALDALQQAIADRNSAVAAAVLARAHIDVLDLTVNGAATETARSMLANVVPREQTRAAFKALAEAHRGRAAMRSGLDRDGWLSVLIQAHLQVQTGDTRRDRAAHLSAPSIPKEFLDRRQLRTQVCAALTQDRGEAAIVALTGMGGSGKSMLARAVARDPVIKDRFADGVIWLEAGTSSVLGWQREILEALGDDRTLSDTAIGRQRLRQAIASRRFLIVLDNVSEYEQFDAFDVMGPDGALLVTARDQDELLGGITTVAVGPFDIEDADERAECRRLLGRYAGADPGTFPPEAEQVLAHCGGLPLALAICGAMMQDGESWQTILVLLQSAMLDELRWRFRDYPYPSLLAAVEAGVNALDEDTRRRYLQLGVFAGNGPVPQAAVARLWSADGLDGARSTALVKRLARRSLLSWDQHTGTVVLHDLLYDYIRSRMSASELAELHSNVATSYLTSWSGLTSGLPDPALDVPALTADHDYGVTHVISHMRAGGRMDDIHRLLAAERRRSPTDIANRWFGIHERTGKVGAYLADIELAWQLAEQVTDRGTTGQERIASVALELRYALITSSLVSIAANLPPVLVAALVSRGVWTARQALAYAARIPDADSKAATLLLLARLPSLKKADLVAQVRQIAVTMENDIQRGWVLAALARLVPEEDRDRLLDEVERLDRPRIHSEIGWMLVHMARWLPESSRERCLVAVSNADRTVAGRMLAALAPHLPPAMLGQAEQIARSLNWPRARVEALTGLIPHVPEDARGVLITEALDAYDRLAAKPVRALLLQDLAPYLPADRLCQEIDAALTAASPTFLLAVAGSAPPARRDEILHALVVAIPHIDELRFRAKVISEAMPLLAEDTARALVDSAVEAASKSDNGTRAWVMVILARYLTSAQLADAVAAARQLGYSNQTSALNELAPHLSADLLRQAAASIVIGDDPYDWATAFVQLTRGMPKTPLDGVLAAIKSVNNNAERVSLLAALASELPTEHVATVTAAIPDAVNIPALPGLFAELARRATGAERDALRHRALQALRTLHEPTKRLSALVQLTPVLSRRQCSELADEILGELQLGTHWDGSLLAAGTALIP